MAYQRADMVYSAYKWTAFSDHDNPYYRHGTDYSLVNKSEEYEVLFFINHLAKKLSWTDSVTKQPSLPGLRDFQKMERMIRLAPGHKTHAGLENWIVSNWNSY